MGGALCPQLEKCQWDPAAGYIFTPLGVSEAERSGKSWGQLAFGFLPSTFLVSEQFNSEASAPSLWQQWCKSLSSLTGVHRAQQEAEPSPTFVGYEAV